jgi:enoyl-[acyl-carrier-protein] reductase (NADH)
VATLLEPIAVQPPRRNVANCITFVLSDKAPAITGQTLYGEAGICH